MTRFARYSILALTMAAFTLPVSARAEMTAQQKEEIQSIVRDYILMNGDLLIESVNNFQKKQEEAVQKQSAGKAKELLAKLKDDKNVAVVGNPEGDVTVVEFFDYNCGFCKKAFAEIQSLLKDDKKVKVVLYDMPILGPESMESSRWSLAAKKQGKYFEYHQALMEHQGAKDEAAYKKMATDLGMDADKLAKDKADPSIEEEIKAHLAIAQELGIQGTPGFLIEEEIFRGYIPYDQIQSSIKNAREKK